MYVWVKQPYKHYSNLVIHSRGSSTNVVIITGNTFSGFYIYFTLSSLPL